MRPGLTRELAPPPRRAPHRRFLPTPALPRDEPGLYPGEPMTCRRNLAAFLLVLAHLALLLAVAKVYRLEGRAFQIMMTLATVALPIHYLLPFRLKLPGFLLASMVGLSLVFGTVTAAIVVTLGVGLILLSRLPISWNARVVAMAAVVAAMAAARAGLARTPVPDVVWPILGSMFMFRMILYLYELKHAETSESFTDALAYFFLVPNVCFVHFPVVDYRTFRRGYFARDIHETQRDGLRMMLRGTLHLLLYRLVYHELLIPMDQVRSVPSLLGFLSCNYLLYLRVSGQFHMACGLLHLFGFSLPETHRHYLLATGFTDYWRRINIYWKDFMVRVVFNPVVFRLKRCGQGPALAVATTVVFLVTWALHAYQSFWLRGTWGVSLPDALFWAILGVLVLVNVQLDARTPRRAKPRAIDLSARPLAIRAAKTVATFATIALLWSLWSSPSLSAWFSMLRRATG
ncbi:MAG: hypothetical protein JWN86_2509 [Planctomycetota bacterium]|nr:hypothetical protein [Planctomycetota bacterium]